MNWPLYALIYEIGPDGRPVPFVHVAVDALTVDIRGRRDTPTGDYTITGHDAPPPSGAEQYAATAPKAIGAGS